MKLGCREGEVTFTRKGLTCRVDRPVSAFTELKVTISLPARRPEKISCRGVVVGCNKLGEKEYRLLLYFLDLDEESSRKLAPYCSAP